jgi:tetratricopeptide (TPR) repeat protein
VPDEKNFALTPLLKPAFDFTHTTNGVEWRDTNSLAHLSRVRAELSDHPEKLVVGSVAKGTLTDLEACRDFYRGNANYPQPIVSGSAASDILVALGKFDAELKELSDAADSRPESRFPMEYDSELVAAMLLPHLSHLRGIARVVELRAIARLDLGQTDEAFKDLKLGLRLADSIANEPLLIDQLVRIDTLNLALQVLREGLARHAWSDAQLAEVETYLASQNLLAGYKSGIRGERACMINGLEYYQQRGVRGNPFDLIDAESAGRTSMIVGVLNRMAGGFYYQNILNIARTHEKYTFPAVDEKARRIYPEFTDRLDQELETLHRESYRHPYQVFTAILFPALTRPVSRVGRAQTYVDAARVACALERFRIANGQLPEKPDALVPRFIDAIPNDVMDGQPLRYHRSDDGGYVLYSIGWNRVDEGGKLVEPENREGSATDMRQGDWVWQMADKNPR